MDTEVSEILNKNGNKKSPVARGNYSYCGRLCDQTFYQTSQLHQKSQQIIKEEENESDSSKIKKTSTYGFSSVSREKRGNFRNSIEKRQGELRYHPDFDKILVKHPLYSISKTQSKSKIYPEQFKICRRHPFAKGNVESIIQKFSLNQSVIQDNNSHKLKRKNSIQSTNPSILKSQISSPQIAAKRNPDRFINISREELVKNQQRSQKRYENKHKIPGYAQFYKKTQRDKNRVTKGFQTFFENPQTQSHFSNYSLNKHPTKPQYQIDFDLQLQRKYIYNKDNGPNIYKYSVQATKINKSGASLDTRKFVNFKKNRYENVDPSPSAKLQYDIKKQQKNSIIGMDKIVSRSNELFPKINHSIKKMGDEQIRRMISERK